MSSALQFAVMTPPGLSDPSLAIAASRAGAIGVLDVAYNDDMTIVRSLISKLAQYARNSFGVKMGANEDDLLDAVLSSRPELLRLVVLIPSSLQNMQPQVEKLHRLGITVLGEAVRVEEALEAQEAGVDGIIAKGYESGGRIGENTSFVLLQQFRAVLRLPVWVHGGIGLHTAAACYVAGAEGLVLDSQMLLIRESALSNAARTKVETLDGSETVCVGEALGDPHRVYIQPGTSAAVALRQTEIGLDDAGGAKAETIATWRKAILRGVGWQGRDPHLLVLGQDAAFAAPLARRFNTVAGILDGMRRAIQEDCQTARSLRPLDKGSPLAQSHGTLYPIVQGPMTRVSDSPGFASCVAENGALPFIALGLMDASQIGPLLQETKRQLGDRRWGVGILGYIPSELHNEQMEVIREHRPPFALIAGGRPDQVRALEREGIPTYLHVPSPELLRMSLTHGVHRLVLEGCECGGHVGPRSSFVLWESGVETFLEWLDQNHGASSYHVLFAGGIHDALSASMVATIAAPLVRKGVAVGVLMGTAYLFTEEAIATGAITAGYRQEAIGCRQTVLLETKVGHAIRVADTPYARNFLQMKENMTAAGMPAQKICDALEQMNLGRLRVASRGIDRNALSDKGPGNAEFVQLDEQEQHSRGAYVMGQIALLRHKPCTMAALHDEVAAGASEVVKSVSFADQKFDHAERDQPSEIAVIGMACILPGATNLQAFWENILSKVDAVREVPRERWDWRTYFDPDRRAEDRVYARWGGFLDDVPFDPMAYGIPPNSLPSIEPVQLLSLEVVRAALEDAGYLRRPFDRERTSVILGAGGGFGDVGVGYISRSVLPRLFGEAAGDIVSAAQGVLPEWTEDSFAGILTNVAAGRVANRFDLGGMNCTVDAACASSLAAIEVAVKELEARSSDMVITGGIDTMQSPFAYLAFSKSETLSPSGRCRPYDAGADGIAISEGLAVLVLKRLSDAEKDGDRVYAVIRGVGASSDGRGAGMTAPSLEGQVRALQRAYRKADVSPHTVGLIEGHGTGTVVGDQTEVAALNRFFNTKHPHPRNRSCALGSVKSMIGHTKAAAGAAGLIKTCLALYHKVLPPTIGVTQPNSRAGFSEGPFYVNSEARPWLNDSGAHSRYAGVSAFGFGGTNFHVVLEEHRDNYLDHPSSTMSVHTWPCELFSWQAPSRKALIEELVRLQAALATGTKLTLRDLAWTINAGGRGSDVKGDGPRLAIVATSVDDLHRKLGLVCQALADSTRTQVHEETGIYYREARPWPDGKTAFLFPGQGSQFINMLCDLALVFPEVRSCFEEANTALRERMASPLTTLVFPPPSFAEAEEHTNQMALMQTNVAQPALAAANLAMLELLRSLGIEADLVAGHSYGEFVALYAAGVLTKDDLFTLSEARGRMIVEEIGHDKGTMAAIGAGREIVAPLLQEEDGGVVIANLNSPHQTVISGRREAVERIVERCRVSKVQVHPIPVNCAFHSPLMAGPQAKLTEFLSTIRFASPRIPVFSNTTGNRYPHEPQAIRALLARHMTSPVDFKAETEALYEAGARIFIEVGPRNVLTKLVSGILGEQPHLAVPSDHPGRPTIVQLHHLLGQLAANGVPLRLERLYEGRAARSVEFDGLTGVAKTQSLSSTTWLVNGGRARAIHPSVNGDHSESPSPPLRIKVLGDGHATVARPVTDGSSTRTPLHQTQERQPTLTTNQGVPMAHGVPSSVPDVLEAAMKFQQLMGRFLDAQRSVMQAYFRNSGATDGHMHEPQVLTPKDKPESPFTSQTSPEFSRVAVSGETSHHGVLLPENVLPTPTPQSGESDHQRLDGTHKGAEVLRFTLKATETSVPYLGPLPAPGRIVLLTDDGLGVAERVSHLLQKRGQAVALIQMGDTVMSLGTGHYSGNIASPEGVERLLETIREEQGAIGGLVHLMPLRPSVAFAQIDMPSWKARLQEDVKSLFLLSKALFKDINAAARAQGGVLMAVTGMGGAFASDGRVEGVFPGHGGVAGLTKAVALEWPEVRVRAIDLNVRESADELAGHVFTEIMAEEGRVEVGYQGSRRLVLQSVPTPLDQTEPHISIDDSWVILVTGGARGITSEVALELAGRYRPTLLLVGRTPLAAEEPLYTAGLNSPHELKEALIRHLQSDGGHVDLGAVEEAYQRLLREREIRRNIAALKQTGARVQYYQVDVRDEGAFGALIERIYGTYGRLDGIVHGAGTIEDKLVKDKSPDSFDRVFGTKTESVFTLSRRVRPESLKFLALFSSIAGRFGNRGQADYAAANEVMNKIALCLDSRWPGRVVSINWGPWLGRGMVSSQVERQFARRGIPLIPAPVGRRRLDEELRYGRKGDVEVVIGGDSSREKPNAKIPVGYEGW